MHFLFPYHTHTRVVNLLLIYSMIRFEKKFSWGRTSFFCCCCEALNLITRETCSLVAAKLIDYGTSRVLRQKLVHWCVHPSVHPSIVEYSTVPNSTIVVGPHNTFRSRESYWPFPIIQSTVFYQSFEVATCQSIRNSELVPEGCGLFLPECDYD